MHQRLRRARAAKPLPRAGRRRENAAPGDAMQRSSARPAARSASGAHAFNSCPGPHLGPGLNGPIRTRGGCVRGDGNTALRARRRRTSPQAPRPHQAARQGTIAALPRAAGQDTRTVAANRPCSTRTGHYWGKAPAPRALRDHRRPRSAWRRTCRTRSRVLLRTRIPASTRRTTSRQKPARSARRSCVMPQASRRCATTLPSCTGNRFGTPRGVPPTRRGGSCTTWSNTEKPLTGRPSRQAPELERSHPRQRSRHAREPQSE